MATDPKEVFQQLSSFWGKASPRVRSTLSLGAIIAALAFAFVTFGPGARKRVLFSGLDPSDTAAVVSALDAAKIDYALGGGGTVVEVPSADVDRARILLAEQDLPGAGNVGFELFENQSFGLTDFAQQVNYRRALQGELERTIGALAPVSGARVHLTLPEKAVFEDEKVPPTASVTMEMHPGRVMTNRQVGAVRHLVSAAVEGLQAEDVTVVDTKGNLLSRGNVDAASAAALDYKRDMERDLERRITRLLERTIGVGGAQVTVAADVDFSQVDTTEEIFDPEQTAIRSEAIQQINEGAGRRRPQGLAGAPANEPGAGAAGAVGGANAASKLVQSKNYEVNRTVVKTAGPSANLRRITVAVLVDGTYTEGEAGAEAEAEAEAVYTPRSAEEIAELQSVIENAVGFNGARGDRIKIASVPFRDRPPTGVDAMAIADQLPTWLPYAAGGGALALAILVWLVLSRGKRPASVSGEVIQYGTTVEQAQQTVAQLEANPPAAAGGTAAHPALPETTVEVRERVLASANEDPERAAEIIRSWMQEAA